MPDAIEGTTPNAIELLREDHKKIRALFDQYEKAAADARKGIADNLIAEIELHTLLEEELVYPTVRRLAADESMIDRAEHDHAEAGRLAEELEDAEPGSEQCDTLIRRLAEQVTAHIDGEEAAIFPELEKLGAEELVGIGQKMLDRREEALTELQEHGPQAPASVRETQQ